MKTFREFVLECELVEGKVEWDNPKKPLQSGLTPREKNRAKRNQIGLDNPDRPSFYSGGPGEKEYGRYGKLKTTHDTEKDKKVSKEKVHKFKQEPYINATKGQMRRKLNHHRQASGETNITRKRSYISDLKEPKD